MMADGRALAAAIAAANVRRPATRRRGLFSAPPQPEPAHLAQPAGPGAGRGK